MIISKRLHLKKVNQKSLIFGIKHKSEFDFELESNLILEICDSVLDQSGDTIDLIFKTKNEEIMVDMTSDWDSVIEFAERNRIKITEERI